MRKAILLMLLTMVSGRAGAEVSELTVALQFGIGYLPPAIMKHNALVEKHLKAAGLGTPKCPGPSSAWARR